MSFGRLGQFVARFHRWIIGFWLVATVALRLAAPAWDQVTHDGNFAYLPDSMLSVQGERWLAESFPANRAKSQIVIVVARKSPLTRSDVYAAYDLIRHFKTRLGVSLSRASDLATLPTTTGDDAADRHRRQTRQRALAAAETAFRDAIDLDQQLSEYWNQQRPDDGPFRTAEPYRRLSALLKATKRSDEAARIQPPVNAIDTLPAVVEADDVLPLLDVWTWNRDIFGKRMISEDRCARLIVLQLSNEFMDTDNMRVLRSVQEELDRFRNGFARRTDAGLEVGVFGSAAVGGDLLQSSADSIKNTELFTVLLVTLTLIVIYRAPLLVVVPLLSIVVSVLVAMSVVALLVAPGQVLPWWDFKVFTTTRIFVVVILFGAGTDYCLFLIARFREELAECEVVATAIERTLQGVGEALAASAFTTIVGLGMMFFADFGKFRYSGPVIGLSLIITLAVCLTLTPAILCAIGPRVFWPGRATTPSASSSWSYRFWTRLSAWVTRRPGLVLVVVTAVLALPAVYGFRHADDVSYNFLNSLSLDRPSRQGARLFQSHFPIGEIGPVTVLVRDPDHRFDQEQGRQRLREVASRLMVFGVAKIRSADDPLGDYEPGQSPSLVSDRGWRLRVLREHPRSQALFFARQPPWNGKMTRIEVVLHDPPFSLDAMRTVDRLEASLRELTGDADWKGLEFALSGTTAALRDLRRVTRSDNRRIQLLVIAAVLAVLLVIIRRPLDCLYMVGSVLFSFYVTLGIAMVFFAYCYGPSFDGLDWKVPLFLFVILLAVGQDYNVYLATRVYQEQQQCGDQLLGLRTAMVHTGAIITSCGLIMGGTFVSMTAGTWPTVAAVVIGADQPLWNSGGWLRGIVEMGFALSLGVMLDTFVVRPIMMPAYFALVARRR